MKTHNLFEPSTDKIFNITQSNNQIILENGKIGKSKITEKSFSNPDEALKQFQKKEWEMLKKGFVLKNSTPGVGEPYLHYFIGEGYTGCLAFENTPKGIYVYKHGWFKSTTDKKDNP